MLKSLAVAILLLGFAESAHAQVPGDGRKENQTAEAGDTQAQARSQRCLCNVKVENSPTKQADKAEHEPYQWHELIAPANVPNWFLVGVAAWAGIMALKTLRAISRQADLMKKQAAAMERQNKIAWDEKRAQLIIQELDTPELSGPGSSLSGDWMLRVRAFVENVGSSRASSVRAYGMLDVRTHSTDKLANKGFLQSFPQIVEAGTKFRLNLGGFGREYEEHASTAGYMAITPDMAKGLRDGEMFIYACGILTYEDLFGECHTTPFRFVWRSIGDDDGRKWPNRSFWMDASDPPTHTYKDA